MVTINIKDKKILYELSKNCRMPLSQLAKHVSLSREVVDYRIKRLIKNGVIKDFILEVNVEALRFYRYEFYLQLQKVEAQKEREIVSYFVKHPLTTWIVTSTSRWSIILDIIARDLQHTSTIISEFIKLYGDHIGEYKLVPPIKYAYFHSKYYRAQKNMVNYMGPQSPEFSFDNVDIQLLQLLSRNARLDYVNLSKQLKLTPNGIKQRLKNLVTKGIIKSFTIASDISQLGLAQYNIQFVVDKIKTDVQRIISYAEQHPNISFYYKPLSEWDIELGIFVSDLKELRSILLDLRNTFPMLKVHDSVAFFEEYKSNYIPEGVFEWLKQRL